MSMRFPICIDSKDPRVIVDTVKRIATVFGGINLEDISAPRCFQIEEWLQNEIDIPVFHDDQHGTSIVTLAALLNALRCVQKDPSDIEDGLQRCRGLWSGHEQDLYGRRGAQYYRL